MGTERERLRVALMCGTQISLQETTTKGRWRERCLEADIPSICSGTRKRGKLNEQEAPAMIAINRWNCVDAFRCTWHGDCEVNKWVVILGIQEDTGAGSG
jgi:hypothetical protein